MNEKRNRGVLKSVSWTKRTGKYADLPCDFGNDGRSITVSIGTVELTAPAFFWKDINVIGVGRNVGYWDAADACVREPTDEAVNTVQVVEPDGVGEDLGEEGNEGSEDNVDEMHCGRSINQGDSLL
jgi:hypothetical protein